uniref:Uncharacterized protein n=1 Tax=Anguilla anguilla TaxID=7936 RepID=A0A0E9SKZ7_ANGAN
MGSDKKQRQEEVRNTESSNQVAVK